MKVSISIFTREGAITGVQRTSAGLQLSITLTDGGKATAVLTPEDLKVLAPHLTPPRTPPRGAGV